MAAKAATHDTFQRLRGAAVFTRRRRTPRDQSNEGSTQANVDGRLRGHDGVGDGIS